MGTGNFSDDFKRDAVAQITERGYPIKEVSERLGGEFALALCLEAQVCEGDLGRCR
jgi:transposase